MRYPRFLLFLLICAPLGAQVVIVPGPEVPISTDVDSWRSGAGQLSPSVASDGREFLITWVEQRESTYTLLGSRLNADGEMLDLPPLELSAESGGAAVAWTGTQYVVFFNAGSILATRTVSQTGELGPIIPIAFAGGLLRIAWSGTTLLAVWNVSEGVMVMPLDGSGRPTHQARRILSSFSPLDISVSASTSDFLVTVSVSTAPANTIVAVQLDHAANLLRRVDIPVGHASPSSLVTASDGDRHLLVWSSSPSARSHSRAVRRGTPAGSNLGDVRTIVFDRYSAPRAGTLIHGGGTVRGMVWNGVAYVASTEGFQNDPEQMIELSRQGELISLRSLATQCVDVLATNRSRYLLACQDFRPETQFDVAYAVVDNAFQVLAGPIDVSRSAAAQFAGTMVVVGESIMASWTEAVPDQNVTALMVGRLRPDGTPIDSRGRRIAAGSEFIAIVPQMASDGTIALLVWEDFEDGGIWAQRISATVDLLDPKPVRLGDGVRPSVSWTGAHFLVVWQTRVAGPPDGMPASWALIVSQRIKSDGTILDSVPIVISGLGLGHFDPAVASGAGVSLVVSHEAFLFTHILGWLVTEQGNVSGPIVITTSGNQSPVVASSSGQFLVAWVSDPEGDHEVTLDWRSVSESGVVSDPVSEPLSFPGFVSESRPVVAPFGNGFILAWNINRGLYGEQTEVAAILLDAAGNPMSYTFTVIANPGDVQSILTLPNGSVQMLYRRFASQAPFFSVNRLFTRSLGFAQP